MAAEPEVPAFLLQMKLQNLLDDNMIVHSGLKDKVRPVIGILECITNPVGDANPRLRLGVVHDIVKLEDVTDSFLIGRARRRVGDRLISHLAPCCSQKELGKAMTRFLQAQGDLLPLRVRAAQANGGHGQAMPDSPGNGGHEQAMPDAPANGGQEQAMPGEALPQRAQADAATPYRWTNQHEEVRGELLSKLTRSRSGQQVFTVYGERGSGKTSIVKYLCEHRDVKSHFDCLAWISLPKYRSREDIYAEIEDQIGTAGLIIDSKRKVEDMADDVFKLLCQRGRYLIVLDDVCSPQSLPNLVKVFPATGVGSSIIITTSIEIDLRWMENFHVGQFRMRPLSYEEKRMLLPNQVEGLSDDDMEHITENCYNSPLAAVLLDGALNSMPDRIRAYAEGQQDLLPLDILKWIYLELPLQLKACFIYLGLFPYGFEIPVRRLLCLWISEGFLDQQPFPRGPEDMAMRCFNELVRRRLVDVIKWKSDGRPKVCRVSSTVHDFLTEKSSGTGLFHVCEGDQQIQHPSDGRRLINQSPGRHLGSTLPCAHSHLRSYIYFSTNIRGKPNREAIAHLNMIIKWERFALLKVLDLEGVYKPELPSSIGRLMLLRFLGLRSTLLDSIPESVGDLPCLETLDLKHTNVTTLSGSIFKSKKLRHLYVKEVCLDALISQEPCACRCLPCRCVRAPPDLHTLTGLYIGRRVTPNVNYGLVNVRKLGVTCEPTVESVTALGELVSKMAVLHSLKLRSTDDRPNSELLQGQKLNLRRSQSLQKLYLMFKLQNENQPPNGHLLETLLPNNLTELTLSMSNLSQDPMPFLGTLRHLVVLGLLGCSYRGEEMVCGDDRNVEADNRGGHFPKLRVLKLWNLENLRSFSVQDTSMAELESLEFRKCVRMESFHGIDRLRNLDELILTDMHERFVNDVRGMVRNGGPYIKQIEGRRVLRLQAADCPSIIATFLLGFFASPYMTTPFTLLCVVAFLSMLIHLPGSGSV